MKKVTLSFKVVEGSRNDDGQFVQHGHKAKEVKSTFFKKADLMSWIESNRETVFKYIEVATVVFSRARCSDGRAFDELTVLARLLP